MDQETRVVQVFAKTPIIGAVKTRLIPLLGSSGACSFHKDMTLRLIDSLSSLQSDIEIWTDRDIDNLFLKELGYPLILQRGADLGEKMAVAITEGLRRHAKVALIGVDLPELDNQYIIEAFEKLDQTSIVLGPTLDGGFGLIAVSEFDKSIFDGLTWGGPEVFFGLVENIRRLGLTYHIASTLWDVDIPEDYVRFQEWLSQT